MTICRGRIIETSGREECLCVEVEFPSCKGKKKFLEVELLRQKGEKNDYRVELSRYKGEKKNSIDIIIEIEGREE